jgi:hypothetical protein
MNWCQVLKLRSALFWDIKPCIVVIPYLCFATTFRSHLQGCTSQPKPEVMHVLNFCVYLTILTTFMLCILLNIHLQNQLNAQANTFKSMVFHDSYMFQHVSAILREHTVVKDHTFKPSFQFAILFVYGFLLLTNSVVGLVIVQSLQSPTRQYFLTGFTLCHCNRYQRECVRFTVISTSI